MRASTGWWFKADPVLPGSLALATALAIVAGGCSEAPAGRTDAAARDASEQRDLGGAARETGAGDAASKDAAGKDAAGTQDSGPSKTYDCTNPHPAWLFCDDFEGMAKGLDPWYSASGWTENIGKGDTGRMTTSTQAHGGKYAVYYPAASSGGYRGADLIWRACAGANKSGCKPLLGYQQLYFRTWIKLAADHKQVHHFLSVGGGPLDDYWAPYGNAGCRPNGKRHMGTTVDFKQGTHATFFYTYFPAMTCDSGTTCAKYANPTQICADCAQKDMPCSSGLECCWGNHFTPSPAVTLPLGKWFCFEMMMKANDVGQKNGEMAYWIDGKLGHQVKQMEWRKESKLQLNMVRLQHYLTTSDAGGHSNRVWFDDVVVSTKPIGCK